MSTIRRVGIIIAIGILFVLLAFVSAEAIFPGPEYEDYCEYSRAIPLEKEQNESFYEEQEQCQMGYSDARKAQSYKVFLFTVVFGIIGVVIGLLLPEDPKTVHEWVGTGLLLGGVLSVLFGTIQGFGALGRFVKPVVLLVELLLVIYLAYKKLGKR